MFQIFVSRDSSNMAHSHIIIQFFAGLAPVEALESIHERTLKRLLTVLDPSIETNMKKSQLLLQLVKLLKSPKDLNFMQQFKPKNNRTPITKKWIARNILDDSSFATEFFQKLLQVTSCSSIEKALQLKTPSPSKNKSPTRVSMHAYVKALLN